VSFDTAYSVSVSFDIQCISNSLYLHIYLADICTCVCMCTTVVHDSSLCVPLWSTTALCVYHCGPPQLSVCTTVVHHSSLSLSVSHTVDHWSPSSTTLTEAAAAAALSQ